MRCTVECASQSPGPHQAFLNRLSTSLTVQGDAKSDLCDLADEMDADLLIVAASSAQGLRKTFGTSTSTYLVHHAPCPTLVIPVDIALAGIEQVTSPQESRELRGKPHLGDVHGDERVVIMPAAAAAACGADA